MKQDTLRTYRKWVIAAGIYNIGFGLPLALPELYKRYYASNNSLNHMLRLGGKDGVAPAEGINQLFVNLFGLILSILGLNLLYAAMDLKNRMGIPVLNTVGRVLAVALIWYYTLNSNITRIMALFSIADLTFGAMFIYYARKLRGGSPRDWLR